ncbi:nucleotidyltransferase domain-containing protein [Thermatribacter velox]|uniref:Nucleotidyltransferase domain-containing protein n=1 Tax=Thermatribacter velox TaxID=3039681 RepID=A0ABZ2YA58_9BACT
MKKQSPGFQFQILEKYLKIRKEELERLRMSTLKKVEEALEKVATQIKFDEAYIFGSLTKPGRFKKDSDIDIGFYGLKDEDFFKMISYLSLELEREVDVIQLEGHRLENKVKTEGIRWKKGNSQS